MVLHVINTNLENTSSSSLKENYIHTYLKTNMDDETKEVLLQLLDSSDEDDLVFEEFFTSVISSDDSAEDYDDDDDVSTSNLMNIIEDYSKDEFKANLKLKRSTVELLIKNYSKSDTYKTSKHGGKPKIGARKEITIYIWYISNTITFKQLGSLFGISKSSAWTAVERVSSWLVSQANVYLKWPQGDVVLENCRKFESKNNLPGIIGAIDATHITIAAPKQNKLAYLNRKQNFSLVLQAVVDADQKFIDICCGEPGSLDDSSVLKRSALYKRAQTNYARLFPENTFLIGDSAYAATNWIVPPFTDYDQLTDQQKSFNYLHSATRVVVENALGLLKERFGRLNKFTEQQNLSSVRKIIASVCVLHNLCIIHSDQYTVMNVEGTPDLPCAHTENTVSTVNRRQILFDYLCQQNII